MVTREISIYRYLLIPIYPYTYVTKYTKRYSRIEVRIKPKYVFDRLFKLFGVHVACHEVQGQHYHLLLLNDSLTFCKTRKQPFFSMRTVDLHTAVFGKWANRTYYHTSYLTQPRALPNWLDLVSCAWKNCNFRQSLQVLIPQGHCSSFVAVFNVLYENSEWHLWSNRNSTHFLRKG